MAKTLSSLKEKADGCRIRRQLEVLMVFTQVLTDSFVFPLNSRFRSLRFTLNGLYLVIFRVQWMLISRSTEIH